MMPRFVSRTFTYGSLCSGIEAASTAWHPLGWTPEFFSEIEPFPSAVLAHHWPDVPNLGDMTKYKEWKHAEVDLIVAGTPCQAFSVAGLRKGLDDPRGNLTLTFLGVLEKYRPRWVVWENVPGVLSDKTGAFGQFLAGLSELGYGWAYRILDAQYFGVAQRRRRVFVVGYLGDWRRAASVLFERESLRGDSPPRREKGEGVTGTLAARTRGGGGLGTDFDCAGGVIPEVVGPMQANGGTTKKHGFGMGQQDWENGYAIPTYAIQERAICENPNAGPDGVGVKGDGTAYTLEARQVPQAVATFWNGEQVTQTLDAGWPAQVAPTLNAHFGEKQGLEDQHVNGGCGLFVPSPTHSLRGEGFDASEDGTGRGTPLVPTYSFKAGQSEAAGGPFITEEFAPTLQAMNNGSTATPCVAGGSPAMRVRRLTPVECERLQGFPDNHTRIPWRKAKAEDCPDGPRYKAIGNSMAIPVVYWLGSRIKLSEEGKL